MEATGFVLNKTIKTQQNNDELSAENNYNKVNQIINGKNKSRFGLLRAFINWTLSSPEKLRAAEKFILSYVQTSYRGYFIDIGNVVGNADQIWTLSFNTESKKLPLVVLHGLGAGLALWVLNFDAFASERPVYAIDLLGFGRSTRPKFSNDPQLCEQQLIESLEEWRREMQLQRFILLGHSMGAFLATSYALSYPEHVKHLILVDPWGFTVRPEILPNAVPLWVRIIGAISLWLNPFWLMRAVGPFGAYLLRVTTADVIEAFVPLLGNKLDMMTHYIHQCNAATPSGEAAFHTISQYFAFAKHPMLLRIKELMSSIGITFIFGGKSWVDPKLGHKVKLLRSKSCVEVKILEDAGHHLQFDEPEQFNRIVVETCRYHGKNKRENNLYHELSNILSNELKQEQQQQQIFEGEQQQKQQQQRVKIKN